MKKIVFLIAFTSSFSVAQSGPQTALFGSIGVPANAPTLCSAAVVLPTDANYTMTANQYACNSLYVTSSVSLTATRNVVAPLNYGQQFTVTNATTGGQSIQIIGTSGTGVTISNGQTLIVNSPNGTSYVSGIGGNYWNTKSIGNQTITLPSQAGGGQNIINSFSTIGTNGNFSSVLFPDPIYDTASTTGEHQSSSLAVTYDTRVANPALQYYIPLYNNLATSIQGTDISGAWTVLKATQTNFSSNTKGISQLYSNLFERNAAGDTGYFYGYFHAWGGPTAFNDEGVVGFNTHMSQVGVFYGQSGTLGTGLTSVQLATFDGCLGDGEACDVQMGQKFAEQSIMVDTSQVQQASLTGTGVIGNQSVVIINPATLTVVPSTAHGIWSGTVWADTGPFQPGTSYAGNVGINERPNSQSFLVTLDTGTYPSPGGFVAGSTVGIVGSFEEEAMVTYASPVGYDCTMAINYNNLIHVWTSTHAYALGVQLVDSNGWVETVTTAGTSGSSAPTWPTSAGTVTDGIVVWTYGGTFAPVAASGKQCITATARYGHGLYNAAGSIFQGGNMTGHALYSDPTWPMPMFIPGAYDATHIAYGVCAAGYCANSSVSGINRPSLPLPDSFDHQAVLTRVGSTVTLSPSTNQTTGVFWAFPAGTAIVVSGCTQTDFNGNFTVATSNPNYLGPSLTWTSAGAAGTNGPGTCMVGYSASVTIQIAPSAEVIGNNNTSLFALLGTNSMTVGSAASRSWTASMSYGVGFRLLDSNGNTETVTVAGVSGSTVPTWPTTLTNTVTDGGVTWEYTKAGNINDELMGGATPVYETTAMQFEAGQDTPTSGYFSSGGVVMQSNGRYGPNNPYFWAQNGSSHVGATAFGINNGTGGFNSFLSSDARPANGGCVICVAGSGSGLPYSIFSDGGSAGTAILAYPNAGEIIFPGNVSFQGAVNLGNILSLATLDITGEQDMESGSILQWKAGSFGIFDGSSQLQIRSGANFSASVGSFMQIYNTSNEQCGPLVIGQSSACPSTASLLLSYNNGQLFQENRAGGTDAKLWETITSTNSLLFQTTNDANSTSNTWLTVTRSGATPTLAAFSVPVNSPQFETTPVTVATSVTPALVATNGLQAVTLSANATPTITGIAAGQRITFQICQPASGGPYTWTWPSTVHGGMTIGTTASTCSMQSFDSFNGTTLVPESAGAINVAP